MGKNVKRPVRFIRKRGIGSSIATFSLMATVAFALAFNISWGDPWVSGILYFIGAASLLCAVACFIVGPAERSSDEAAEKRVDPNPNAKSQGNTSKDNPDAEVTIPPNTPFEIDKIASDASIKVSASEELDPDDTNDESDDE